MQFKICCNIIYSSSYIQCLRSPKPLTLRLSQIRGPVTHFRVVVKQKVEPPKKIPICKNKTKRTKKIKNGEI